MKLNRIAIALLCVFAIACQNNAPLKYKTYRSDSLHFSLKAPEDWQTEEKLQGQKTFALTESPKDSLKEYKGNLVIWLEELPIPVADSVYAQAAVTQIKISNAQLNISPLTQILRGNKHYFHFQFDFSTVDSMHYAVEGYTLLHQLHAYNMIFTCEKTKSATYKPILDTILNSFTAL
ncbi:MAG: hypothetical protein JNJ58_00700 [Chitinophagaceae bacterium]|nr:hypothetical protein [Chitinophagaceae bacterium]